MANGVLGMEPNGVLWNFLENKRDIKKLLANTAKDMNV